MGPERYGSRSADNSGQSSCLADRVVFGLFLAAQLSKNGRKTRCLFCFPVKFLLPGLNSWLQNLTNILFFSKKCLDLFGTFWGPPGAGNGPKMCPREPALEPRSIVRIRPLAARLVAKIRFEKIPGAMYVWSQVFKPGSKFLPLLPRGRPTAGRKQPRGRSGAGQQQPRARPEAGRGGPKSATKEPGVAKVLFWCGPACESRENNNNTISNDDSNDENQNDSDADHDNGNENDNPNILLVNLLGF